MRFGYASDIHMRIVFLGAVLLWACFVFATDQLPAPPDVIHAVRHDVSPLLRDIPPAKQANNIRRIGPSSRLPFPQIESGPVSGQLDPVVQMSIGAAMIPAPASNFEGIAAGCCIPPDTSGAVGPNHFVQVVNHQFAIFNKNGQTLLGPVATNTLWSGFGGLCQDTNYGDGVVVYDWIADRWVISQFAFQAGGAHLECVAVSTTNDPTGSWYRYSFSFPYFNDYPKWGVWPDAYYTSYILRRSDFSPINSYICAFDRARMLYGATATAQCFNVAASYLALLPADVDGASLPPPGTPNFLMNFSQNKLNLWKFRVNWTAPSSSSFTGPTAISVAPFTPACNPTRICIPQTGTTQMLDSISDRLMFRLAYRNAGTSRSLIANHTVDAGSGISGIRWYEIRNPEATPVLFQQGTYAPDTNHRWMGSIAADRAGNIGVGYSVSGSGIHPGIRYTGRQASDPLNSLPQGESTIISGGGSQTGYTRWGDYSHMTVDSTNDCSFWYTTEYLTANGSFNWHTRIGSFAFPSCSYAACSAAYQLLANTGFESGNTYWWISPSTIINNTNNVYPPHSGTWKAQLNGKGYANTASLFQQFSIPARACKATLTFWLRVTTAETTTTAANDTLKVQILDPLSRTLKDLAVYSNLSKSSGYVQKTFDLTQFSGKAIRLRFYGSENSSRQTTFLVDDLALSVTR